VLAAKLGVQVRVSVLSMRGVLDQRCGVPNQCNTACKAKMRAWPIHAALPGTVYNVVLVHQGQDTIHGTLCYLS
jgi:hypothetical protein